MTISRVANQGGGVTVDSSATATRAFPGNVTSGNLVYFVACKFDPSATFTAGNLAKSAGSSTIGAISLDKVFDDGAGLVVGIWSAIVTGTGSLTLTCTSTAGSYWAVGSDELASTVGWDASRVETTGQGSGTAVTQTTGNMTSAGAAAFVGGTALNTSGAQANYTQDAAFTRVYLENDASSHEPGVVMIRIVSSGTTDAVSSDNGVSSVPYVAAGVVYKESAGGGGGGGGTSVHETFGSRRQRPGRGPYSLGRYFRRRDEAFTQLADLSVSLSGQSITAAQGSLSPATSVAATGQSTASAQGTLSSSLSIALSGQSIASSQGGLSPALSKALSGQALTFAQGTLGVTSQVPLTGITATFAQGTVSAGNDITVALSGQALTSAQGSLAPALSIAISGQALTGSQGTVSAGNNVSVALTGQSISVVQGTLSASLARALSGSSFSFSQGTVTASSGVVIALTGQQITASQGNVKSTLTLSVNGQQITASQGVVTLGAMTVSVERTVVVLASNRTVHMYPSNRQLH